MECPGSNHQWKFGTGNPICPVCHRGPGGLGVKRPSKRNGRWTGKTPIHERRQS